MNHDDEVIRFPVNAFEAVMLTAPTEEAAQRVRAAMVDCAAVRVACRHLEDQLALMQALVRRLAKAQGAGRVREAQGVMDALLLAVGRQAVCEMREGLRPLPLIDIQDAADIADLDDHPEAKRDPETWVAAVRWAELQWGIEDARAAIQGKDAIKAPFEPKLRDLVKHLTRMLRNGEWNKPEACADGDAQALIDALDDLHEELKPYLPAGRNDAPSGAAGNESFYDEEVAPALAALGRGCKSRGMSLIACVEYAPGELGKTFLVQDEAHPAMHLLALAQHTLPNIDAFVIGAMKQCKQRGWLASDQALAAMVFKL